MNECPVCRSTQNPSAVRASGDWTPFDCPNCGGFRISGSALAESPQRWTTSERARAVLSHAIRKMQSATQPPLLTTALIDQVLLQDALPEPSGLMENLLALVAGRQLDPGTEADVELANDRARVGAMSQEGVLWGLDALKTLGLVTVNMVAGQRQRARLTSHGWERLQELRRGNRSSRLAFMAMKYGDPELEQLYLQVLKPAVAVTGFTLYRLDENPPAGLIDVRLRAELRRARFLLADLSHGNAGAYWEAGFMEGLGKPVIYLCKRSVFAASPSHFDTNHSHHVLWSTDATQALRVELSATIRATLPDEATPES